MWVNHHIVTLLVKRKSFINFMSHLQDHLWAMWVCLHHAHLSLLHGISLCLCHEPLCSFSSDLSCACTFVLTLRTIVKPMPWTFSIRFKGAHPYSHLTHFCPYFRDFFVCAYATPPLPFTSMTLVHVHTLHLFVRTLGTFLFMFAPLHHIAYNDWLWYHLLGILILEKSFLSEPII